MDSTSKSNIESVWYHGSFHTLQDTISSFFHPEALEKILPFLEGALTYGMPLGKYRLIQEESKDLLYANVEEGVGKGTYRTALEAHDKYIDIHAALHGIEKIGIAPLTSSLTPKTPYDREKDICFFDETPKKWIMVQDKEIALIPPGICHAPLSGDDEVVKLVMKIHVKYCKAALCNISLESVYSAP